jgi:hypothetical protein
MINYYVLKKISKKDLPNKDMFSTFNRYKGTFQMQKVVENGDIYVCTDGSEIEEGELEITLQVFEVEE